MRDVEITHKTNDGQGVPPGGLSVVITNDVSTTAVIVFSGYLYGSVIFATGSMTTSITLYGSDSPSGTFAKLYDGTLAGPVAQVIAAINVSSAGGVVPLPDACRGVAALKIVTNVASETVIISRKA